MGNLLILAGQTATGKSDLGLTLAKRFNGEVVSADSMQVYSDLEFITFPPSPEEMREVPHHLIGCVAPSEEFNVARYLELARGVVRGIWARGRLPIVVGGTGMYIKVLLEGIFQLPMASDEDLRRDLLEKFRSGGLYNELERIDPESARYIHPNDARRIVRALEVYYLTGRPLSYWKERREGGIAQEADRLWFVVLFAEREQLKERIRQRLERLGAEDVERAYEVWKRGLSRTAKKVLGLKELVEVKEGKIDLEEAKDRIAKATYQYARRQMIWFRKQAREVSAWTNAEVWWVNIRERDRFLTDFVL